MDKAKGQSADLQSQLDRAKSQSEAVQSQLEKETGRSAELQAQVDRASAQSADLKTQLGDDAARLSQLAAQLDQSKSQSADLQSRLHKAEGDIAQMRPLAQKARQMPIETSYETVRGGPFEFVNSRSSITLHINNLYLEPFNVDITITGPSKSLSYSITIRAGGTLSVEKLAAGDKVDIASQGYDPVSVTVQ